MLSRIDVRHEAMNSTGDQRSMSLSPRKLDGNTVIRLDSTKYNTNDQT